MPTSLQHLTRLLSLEGILQGVVLGQENGQPGHSLGNTFPTPLTPASAWRGF